MTSYILKTVQILQAHSQSSTLNPKRALVSIQGIEQESKNNNNKAVPKASINTKFLSRPQ
jgi:hypothetical protein